MSNPRAGFIKSVLYGIDGKELPNEQKIDTEGHSYVKGYVKDPDTLSWVPATQSIIKTDNLTVTTPSIQNIKMVDENGTAYGVKHVNNKPRVSAMPYLYDIAEGNVSGHTPWGKIGFNGDIGTTEEDIWVYGGVYTWPDVEMQMEVVSDSVEDDPDKGAGVPGTGVHSVYISYLDDAFNSKIETVTLNGTGVVTTTATDIYRIQAFRAVTVGSSGAAVGTITLRHLSNTPIYGTIAPKYTRARNITYTIPLGYNLYVTSTTIGVYGATKGIRVTTRADYDSDTQAFKTFFVPYSEYVMGNGVFFRPLEMPVKFISGTRLKTSAIADAAGAVVSVSHRGWLETV